MSVSTIAGLCFFWAKTGIDKRRIRTKGINFNFIEFSYKLAIYKG
jgi:hypothetical protein